MQQMIYWTHFRFNARDIFQPLSNSPPKPAYSDWSSGRGLSITILFNVDYCVSYFHFVLFVCYFVIPIPISNFQDIQFTVIEE